LPPGGGRAFLLDALGHRDLLRTGRAPEDQAAQPAALGIVLRLPMMGRLHRRPGSVVVAVLEAQVLEDAEIRVHDGSRYDGSGRRIVAGSRAGRKTDRPIRPGS